MRASPHRPRAALGALLLAFAGVVAMLVGTAPAATADTLICEQYGTATVQGRYIVQNNRWGTGATQCVTATDTGFRLTRADGSVPTDGPPKAYPSLFNGCHYTRCSPGTALPARIDGIAGAPSAISYGFVGDAVYNASYDIWLDPAPRTDGVNRTEIMIWFHRNGPVQPIGSPVGTATVGGRSWQVWTGGNGSNDVISFVAPTALAEWNFDVMDFVRETVSRGMARGDWYLTSVQAGFEPWQNGAGLAVHSFSSAVNLGTPPTGPEEPGPEEPGPGEPGSATTCRVTVTPNVWTGGFTADVTVANTGPTAVEPWELAFTLPAGHRITQSWNAAVSPSSGTVTATALAHNARIPAGGSQSFGFQGTYSGTFAPPSGFALGGVPCS
ncbi:cellulose binding domain-containing protein [Streptomyces sp. NPDC047974]|uniref:GH12 family glycosyl hydrolase domain-containing protein n=1 Tax=Streptomyces sp. NPDC047974 TaxID=3154343 RepID=UPI0033E23DD6